MSATSVVIDDVLDAESVSKIKESIDESTRDPFFYTMNDNHLYDNFCLAMINIASEFYDLSSSVGYEFWTRLNRCVSDWHCDKDEKLYDEQKIVSYPLCTIIYYPHVDNMRGGELLLGSDKILPKTNRLVIFAPGIPHNVESFTGDRISMMVNPWNRVMTSKTYEDNI
tara:strand:+ start:34 stop:537 length:504 start_codon:yes stop_codon:yes gene_type:complete